MAGLGIAEVANKSIILRREFDMRTINELT